MLMPYKRYEMIHRYLKGKATIGLIDDVENRYTNDKLCVSGVSKKIWSEVLLPEIRIIYPRVKFELVWKVTRRGEVRRYDVIIRRQNPARTR